MAMRSRSATLPDLHSGDSRPCTTCGLLLRAEEQRQFASKQGVVYCTDCYHSSYSRGHCTGCNKIVLTHGRPWVQHGEKVWHKLCIKCRTCAKLLVAPLVDLEGMPTCEPCFMRCYPRELLRPMPKESAPAAPVPQPVVATAAAAAKGVTSAAKAMTSAAVSSQRTMLPVVAPLVWGGGATAAGVPSSFPARQTVDIKELERGSKRAVAAAAAATVAASIPTPVISEYDGGATSASNSPELQDTRQSKFVRAMDAMRIMSPVEVAEKEGLPRPRVIVDPEFGLLARVESQPVPAQDVRRPSVSGSGPGSGNVLGHVRSSSAKVDAIKSMLNQSVSPIDTSVAALYRPPLSPSLKNPNSPTARAGSSRSVSFRFDQTMESDASDEYDEEPVAPPRPKVHEPVQEQQQQSEQEDEDEDEPKSLADYVLSKASSNKSKARLPSVADAIKKFSSPAMTPASAQRGDPLDRSQIPELKDLIRTHQREPPQEPTIPALDKHSRILKSRPRNNNRRQPTGSPQQQQQQLVPQMDTLPSPTSTVGPNQCARCARAIEDTWFRLSDGRQVHVECFTCQGCDKLIDDGVYVLENNVEFHPPCVPPTPPVVSVSPIPSSVHQQQQQQQGSSLGRPMGPREPRREEMCDRCHDHLVGPRFQLTNGKQYHPECFACAGCGQRFDEGSYVCFEGQEYHHQCVEKFAMAQKQEEDAANRGAGTAAGAGAGAADGLNGGGQDAGGFICAQCDGNIEGVFLRHNEAVFHPECFCCCDCQQAITPGMPFGEVEGCPCCEGCLEQRAASVAQQQMQRQRQQQMQMQNNWANSRQQQQPTKTGY
ncbi:hypothetical protein BX661DRAFT_177108 [Kickxella alabastrina]|uniref:uncharacterized protein n=1 Tax=Kickxella alabastrina TaxID=61397 RepID=UPI00221FAB50|nr:uncharacterized protein BX661DRAFT_177108 [Kickxella alabastrina]KAI7834382.1 hypothetical protein BX661DRAFT_177108 [Kickxella alabastrina]